MRPPGHRPRLALTTDGDWRDDGSGLPHRSLHEARSASVTYVTHGNDGQPASAALVEDDVRRRSSPTGKTNAANLVKTSGNFLIMVRGEYEPAGLSARFGLQDVRFASVRGRSAHAVPSPASPGESHYPRTALDVISRI